LLIASTPVRAAQPEEKARASRKTIAMPVSPFSTLPSPVMWYCALSVVGRSPNA
jgi:hypothetical protein